MTGSYGLMSLQTDDKAQKLIALSVVLGKVGDANWDGSVNSLDFATYRKFLLGKINSFNPETQHSGDEVADLDGNGACNSIDFAFLRKYLLGHIDYFPA